MATILIKSLDTAPPLETQFFFANGNPIDLTGATVTLSVRRQRDGGEFFSFPVEIINAEKGQVRYDWRVAATDPVGAHLKTGPHDAAWEINFSDGTRTSVPNTEFFQITVLRSLDDKVSQ